MNDTLSSRRMFIGTVAAGTALLAPMLYRRGWPRAVAPGADGITIVPGRLASLARDPAELDHWSKVVGTPISIGGENARASGVVDLVEPGAIESRAPAGVRRQSFVVRFAVDLQDAPIGNSIYDVGTEIDGLSRLFLLRSADRGDRAILTALFN